MNIKLLAQNLPCLTSVQIYIFLNFYFILIFSFLTLFIYLFIFVCIGSSLLHAGFLQLQRVGATLRCGAGVLIVVASLVAEHGLQACGLSSCGSRSLERRLSSCGAQSQLLRSMWDLPGSGLEPVSPALAGGFLTTEPPGKPCTNIFFQVVCYFSTNFHKHSGLIQIYQLAVLKVRSPKWVFLS